MCNKPIAEGDSYKSVPSRHKACHKAKMREKNGTPERLAYERARAMAPHRVAARKAYAKTERGKEVHKRATAKWQSENPEKRQAQIMVGNAVRDGKLTKPNACEDCGRKVRLQGHHHDYTKPLEVTWLCTRCHRERHK